jgi:hypothetical protein
MKKEEEIPIYYLYLHSKIWESKGSFASEKEIKEYLFQWKIPKKIRALIIKELMSMKLLEKDTKNNILINRPEFSLENINKYYEKFGIF